LFLFNAPFALVVLGALAGVHWLQVPARLGVKLVDERGTFHPTPWRSSLAAVPLWLLLWSAPMVAVRLLLGPEHVLWDIGLFFSQLAVVTFGGAHAVLAHMAQEAVSSFGWLAAGEMAVGLGLAETTPGPLIMVTQFVGYLAAFRAPEPFWALVAGTLGALLTTGSLSCPASCGFRLRPMDGASSAGAGLGWGTGQRDRCGSPSYRQFGAVVRPACVVRASCRDSAWSIAATVAGLGHLRLARRSYRSIRFRHDLRASLGAGAHLGGSRGNEPR
jgi:hypothetical protein